MKRVLRLLFLAFLFVGFASCQTLAGCESREDEVRRRLMVAFDAVSEAERAGGDVSELVAELGEALELLNGGEGSLERVESIVDRVLAEAPMVAELGAASIRMQQFWMVAVIGVVVVSAVFVWRFGPRVFWSLWLRSKSGWRVRS